MSKEDLPDIWGLIDLCTPWCVHVVATLRIADKLDAGIDQIEDLAAAAGADANSLRRVLRHLVSKGLFLEPAPARFALNEPAKLLRHSAMGLGLDLEGIGGRMAYAWGSLLDAVRTGAPAYDKVFGRPFWEDLQAHPKIAASFDALMGPAGHGTPDPEVLLAGDWESVSSVIDVGGGTGSLLAEILRAHPTVRGTLVDLPFDGGSIGRDVSGRGSCRSCDRSGPELLRPPAGRGRSVSAEERARRLARSRGEDSPLALRRGGRTRRARCGSRRRLTGRGWEPFAGTSHAGLGGREEPEPIGVPRAGSRSRPEGSRRRAATVGPLCRRVPSDLLRCLPITGTRISSVALDITGLPHGSLREAGLAPPAT